MKRINEKVKDLVEVRDYKNLRDFYSDPAETLNAYHFTDLTADMMSKWLEKISTVQPESGQALALAGYRGVGKSHFLATLGAILSHPELRSRITDSLVSGRTQLLKRRRYPVAFVRRGTCPTLFEELKEAIAKTFLMEVSSLSDSLPDLLKMSAEIAGELPFVLFVDTASERASRVSRNDGEILGEIAEIAKDLNIFVGVALDDDIAGADGVNAAIARVYTIDYLDQEHLYKIVNTYVFPKARQTSPLIHEIYTYFREVMPHFRWSEQRFTSLYPLHPIILEIAPFVRLYATEFALLSFASEAGKRILGRPANSLIALDEVFDCAEKELRKVKELREAFDSFDRLNTEVIGSIPVMQRLQAKLILKGLMIMSLDGNGATAGEISAALLVFDENDPQIGLKMVENLLETFVAVLPEHIQCKVEEGRDPRYSLKVCLADDLDNSLNQEVAKVPLSVIPKILKKIYREKFSDCTFTDETENQKTDWTDAQIVWRGSLRRGRVCWSVENPDITNLSIPLQSEFLDWVVIISEEREIGSAESAENEIPKVHWQYAPLKKDEIETILRYYVLLNSTQLREQYEDQIRKVVHSYSLMAEKIWKRVFLEDGKLVIEGLDYNFTEEARNAQSLTEIFSIMLEPLFEMKFPSHPRFTQTLGMTEVASLVNDLFSGTRQNLPEVQRLAETFGLPLGLVVKKGQYYVPEAEEKILELNSAKEILQLVRQTPEESVSLKTIYRRLKLPPVGLVREAQHLILTALVANRQIEFVTTKGDRINRRSLDLKIIWDDIEGVALPSTQIYSAEKLKQWVKLLTGDSTLALDLPEDRERVEKALEVWLEDWQAARLLERFNELPDEILNSRIWRLATLAEKSFGAVATSISALLDRSITLEECLHRIVDAFSDSEEEFDSRTRNLVVLEDFISGTKRREEIRSYLAVCETTDDERIEHFRERLFEIIEETIVNPNQLLNREMENLWQSFHPRFSEYFAFKHDLVMKSHHLQERFDEIMRSDAWWEFENLSKLPIFPSFYWDQARSICRKLKELNCRFNVRDMLQTHPFCACSFSLTQISEWENLPQKLEETIQIGRKSYRQILLTLSDTVAQLVSHFAKRENDDEYTVAATQLLEIFVAGEEIPLLSNAQLTILLKSFENLPGAILLESAIPHTRDFISRRDLREMLNKWLNEIPEKPVLIKT